MALLAAVTAQAFSAIPRESAAALGVTKNKKPFTEGLVFVNGKFVPPPYVVERWGTGIRINKIPVTGQIIDWNEFLKTQKDVGETAAAVKPATKVVFLDRELAAPRTSGVVVEIEERRISKSDDSLADSLDDLFDDDGDDEPSPSDPSRTATSSSAEPEAKSRKAPTKARPAVVLKGAFVKNAASRALVAKINAQRAEIDRTLRGGGFICFGDKYARISGDSAAMVRLLTALPEIQMRSETAEELRGAVRAADLLYLHELVCDELFANRIDYRALQEYRAKLRKNREWKKMMEVPQPLF